MFLIRGNREAFVEPEFLLVWRRPPSLYGPLARKCTAKDSEDSSENSEEFSKISEEHAEEHCDEASEDVVPGQLHSHNKKRYAGGKELIASKINKNKKVDD